MNAEVANERSEGAARHALPARLLSSRPLVLTCYRPSRPTPGGGGLFEVSGWGRAGGEGVGRNDEKVLPLFSSLRVELVKMAHSSAHPVPSVSSLVSCRSSRLGVSFFLSLRLLICLVPSSCFFSCRCSSRSIVPPSSRFSSLLVPPFRSLVSFPRLVFFIPSLLLVLLSSDAVSSHASRPRLGFLFLRLVAGYGD